MRRPFPERHNRVVAAPNPGPSVRARREARRASGGSSLIEVLVAMSIMALVLMGIFAGYETSKDRSAADAALSTMIERAHGLTYRSCVALADLRRDFDALPRPSGVTARLDTVAYLRAVDVANGADGVFGPGCPVDRGAQLLTISVSSTATGSLTFRGQTVLRDPKAAP